ncbi:MAG: AAA family ATPase [Acidimicrobiales bacterium]|nr:AAA family ATPase [Acidimicrobiales bacterium]
MSEPAPPPPAAVAETHISTVLFDGDLAVKRYKPVRTGFLDHTTVEGRRVDCEREVALNRRLAPDVYLGVAEVRDPDGEVCDHLVLMRRLDPARRLATLARAGGGRDEVAAVARRMAEFHAGAARSAEISAVATPEALAARWRADLAETAATGVGRERAARLDRLADLAERSIRARRPLLEARIAGGHVVDGQGDLLADDIFCLDDGPRILDCLAFADELRWGDEVADLAFLAMDLEHLGRPDLADHLWATSAEASGAVAPGALVDLSVAQRAVVRAKVHALRADQLAVGDPARVEEARVVDEFCALALAHLERSEPRVVLVGGGPGTGKSTLARALAADRGWALVRSDEVRRELLGPTAGAGGPPLGAGRYAPEVSDRVYTEVVRRGLAAVGDGAGAVLDASWHSAAARRLALDAADAAGARVTALRATAPDDVCRARVARRAEKGVDASEATPEVVRWMADRFDPWPDAVVVDTSGPKEASREAAVTALGPSPSDVR